MLDTPALGENPVVFDWQWTLSATPEQLWPLVSDTNRMNVLAAMAPATFSETPIEDGGSARTGQTKQLGLGVTWDEHPFEWVYPQGFSVLREFHNGVLACYRSSVLLLPQADGTRLIHRVELIPRLGIMRPFVEREGVKQQRSWEHAYRAVDAYLTAGGPWPFSGSRKVKSTGPSREAEAEIERESPSPELELRLFRHVLTEHDHELTHMRPFLLADRWREDRQAMLEAFQYATSRKLIKAQWSLLCPHCRGAKGTSDRLSGLPGTVHCNSCNIHFSHQADAAVELSFTPEPRYRQVQAATYCVGGPGSTPHVYFQAKLHDLAGRAVGLTLPPGSYRVRGPRIAGTYDFTYHGGEAAPEGQHEEGPEVFLDREGFQGEVAHFDGPKLRMRLINKSQEPLDVVIEDRHWREDVLSLAYLKDHPEWLAAFQGSGA